MYAVSSFLLAHHCAIEDNRQFGDRHAGRFFMRLHFQSNDPQVTLNGLRQDFRDVATRYDMRWQLQDVTRRPRMLVMVSKRGHCLNDLLYRWLVGELPADIPVIVSNHEDLEPLARFYGIAFEHVPVTPQTKPYAEERLLELADEHAIDLVVLARYMQVLSGETCERLAGRAINIHHSFLPSFKGRAPYRQAYEQGVKLIGATAHYVTADLDEGPIIEQEVARVDHTYGPDDLVAVGRNIECLALAKAVRYHVEHRVLLNGSSTVVFR